MIAIVSDVFETDYVDVIFFHQLHLIGLIDEYYNLFQSQQETTKTVIFVENDDDLPTGVAKDGFFGQIKSIVLQTSKDTANKLDELTKVNQKERALMKDKFEKQIQSMKAEFTAMMKEEHAETRKLILQATNLKN